MTAPPLSPRSSFRPLLGLLCTLVVSFPYPTGRADPAATEQGSDSVASAVERSLDQLALGYAKLRADDVNAARQAFGRVLDLVAAPDHHRWEARQRLREIDRRQAGLPAREPELSRVAIPVLPSPALTFHVSPSGSDQAPGTLQRPFATLTRSRDAIRSLKRAGGLPEGGVAVVIHAGEYPVNETFVLVKQDSGTERSPIVYRAMSDASPRFRGGVRLGGFSSVTDPKELERLPEPARSKVVRLDLRSHGVKNLLPLRLGGFASGHGFKTHPAHELFFDGEALQLARGPNAGFLHLQDVTVKDGTKGYDREGSKVGQFLYEGNRPSRWAAEPDLLLYGYWFWDWADSYERVESIDVGRRMITLAKPYHRYGYSVGAPFYAINALCELDTPGEWYLDRKTETLFLYPPSDPASAVIELSLFADPMVVLKDVSHVRFERLTWELGSGDAIRIQGGDHCLVAGCTVRRFAGNGVTIRGGTAHGVLSTDIHSMGRGGVIAGGGDRKTLAPGRHFVENCDIHRLSRIDHTYTPAVVLSGVKNRIAHNRLHDISSSAMRVGGNDHVIEFNEVFRVVLESDDQGGADMFGNATYRGNVYRHNYWHHIGTPYGPLATDSKLGQAGIRLDDAISGTLLYGNVFHRCSSGQRGFGSVQIHGGKDNVVDNNVFVEGAVAISFSAWSEKRWRDFVKEALADDAIDPDLYLERYPELAQLEAHPNVNHIWRNLVVRCDDFIRRDPKGSDFLRNLVMPKNDSPVEEGSPLFDYPDLAPIPFSEIGLYRDDFRRGSLSP